MLSRPEAFEAVSHRSALASPVQPDGMIAVAESVFERTCMENREPKSKGPGPPAALLEAGGIIAYDRGG